ncbi:iron-containing alcohol dehydrogenase [Breznakiella homolactica]|uniref:Iron-containing alcohol dehydrogenase n=1 Tax=Breznakiella homolactica TaxID=2798577 RepID=A0A7T7XQP4_9SPIR|nr:iron-containing alcohol dehydrogenase [Breznakiella homolactica]QQO10737.1 iron-containing alcohol dehydrogenase [Breznakiella homolactica]
MNDLFEQAKKLLSAWKGDSYIFGRGVLPEIGRLAAGYGKRALLVCNTTYMKATADAVAASLEKAGVSLAGGAIVPDAGPNAPREDVYRIETYILHHKPDCIIAVGGGSAIDACKAANVLACLGKDNTPEIEAYFGTGLVTEALTKTGAKLLPVIAVQTSASSGAHLTKYSNVTDPVAGQKKLIVDDAITPPKALFDYDVTASMPVGVTVDGALDAVAHCFEVFSGVSADKYDLAASITECAISLTAEYAPRVVKNPGDMEAREAIGMATDLGGYAIMVGGTNGAHLTSFSLVDLTSHGKACGIMNPYYAVFFSPVIEKQLRLVGGIFKKYGYIPEDLDSLTGRELGTAVARGMIAFGKAIGAPVTLRDLPGFDESYIRKALDAAKDPQLEMKLRNMPVPLTAALVEDYMGPILQSAVQGDFSMIRLMV